MLAGHVLDNALVAEPDDCWPVGAMRHAQRERRVEAGGDESVGVGRRVLYAHAARLHEPMRDLRAVPRVHGFAENQLQRRQVAGTGRSGRSKRQQSRSEKGGAPARPQWLAPVGTGRAVPSLLPPAAATRPPPFTKGVDALTFR